jgi:hypothetical protein
LFHLVLAAKNACIFLCVCLCVCLCLCVSLCVLAKVWTGTTYGLAAAMIHESKRTVVSAPISIKARI